MISLCYTKLRSGRLRHSYHQIWLNVVFFNFFVYFFEKLEDVSVCFDVLWEGYWNLRVDLPVCFTRKMNPLVTFLCIHSAFWLVLESCLQRAAHIDCWYSENYPFLNKIIRYKDWEISLVMNINTKELVKVIARVLWLTDRRSIMRQWASIEITITKYRLLYKMLDYVGAEMLLLLRKFCVIIKLERKILWFITNIFAPLLFTSFLLISRHLFFSNEFRGTSHF